MIKRKFSLLLVLAVTCVSTPYGSAIAADEKAAALAEINATRKLVGLPLVTSNQLLNQAAQSHSDYLITNINGISHDQTPGLSGYTGATPALRITAAGYSWNSVNEVIDGGTTSGQKAVRNLVMAIYHRFGILSPSVAEVGIGLGSGVGKMSNTVIDFGATLNNAVTLPTNWLGTYPVSGQTGVPRDFLSDTEVPDPVPDQNRVGYPISIHAGKNDKLGVSSFSLTKLTSGLTAFSTETPIAVRLLAARDDAHVPDSAAAIVPLTLLDYGSRYRAAFVGTRNGLPVEATWEFTTADYSTIVVAKAYQRVGTAQVARVQVSGGNGTLRMNGYNAQSHTALAPEPQIKEIEPGIYEVSVLSSSEVTVHFADDDAQTKSAIVSFANPIDESTTVVSGWNLIGNPLLAPIVAKDRFGQADLPIAGITDSVITVWKWLPATSQWAFYAPSMTPQALSDYAAGKGYVVLDQILAGEGYWINATKALSFSRRSGIPSPTVPQSLNAGWNLLATGGEPMTPAAFDKVLGSGVLSGDSLCFPDACWRVANALAATPSFSTLWSWDGSARQWRFYAPTLALQGGNALSNYATSKGYSAYDLAENIYLRTGEGFWVNK